MTKKWACNFGEVGLQDSKCALASNFHAYMEGQRVAKFLLYIITTTNLLEDCTFTLKNLWNTDEFSLFYKPLGWTCILPPIEYKKNAISRLLPLTTCNLDVLENFSLIITDCNWNRRLFARQSGANHKFEICAITIAKMTQVLFLDWLARLDPYSGFSSSLKFCQLLTVAPHTARKIKRQFLKILQRNFHSLLQQVASSPWIHTPLQLLSRHTVSALFTLCSITLTLMLSLCTTRTY